MHTDGVDPPSSSEMLIPGQVGSKLQGQLYQKLGHVDTSSTILTNNLGLLRSKLWGALPCLLRQDSFNSGLMLFQASLAISESPGHHLYYVKITTSLSKWQFSKLSIGLKHPWLAKMSRLSAESSCQNNRTQNTFTHYCCQWSPQSCSRIPREDLAVTYQWKVRSCTGQVLDPIFTMWHHKTFSRKCLRVLGLASQIPAAA